MVPGSICSGIHSLRMLSSPITCPPCRVSRRYRNSRSLAALRFERTSGGALFLCATDLCHDALDGITETDGQHGLARVLPQIDDAASGIFEKNVAAIGEQVVLGGGANGINQALAEFTLQEPRDATNFLQGETT